MTTPERHGFRKDPEVSFCKEDDGRVSAFIKLRDNIKAHGVVQPNPNVLAFFLIASDGLPVGIRLHEPASGLAVCELMTTLIEGPDGPEGIDSDARHHFLTTPEEISAVLHGFKESIEGLTPPAPPQSDR